MEINAAQVKELRAKTGVGMMKCKEALVDAAGDIAGAEKLLRKQGEDHPMETIGAKLRNLMPWLKEKRLVDRSKN